MKEQEEVINAGAARRELAQAVDYGDGCCSSDDTQWFIQNLLIQEIKRLRGEIFHLRQTAINYLGVFEKEHGGIDV